MRIVVKSLDSHTCIKVEPAKEEPAKEGEEAVGLCVIVIVFPFFPLRQESDLDSNPIPQSLINMSQKMLCCAQF